MKKIVFFNHHHKGDLHVSRGLIIQIMKKVYQLYPDIEFIYSHRNDPELLKDIPNLGYDRNIVNNLNPHESFIINGETAYINTWYDQQHQKYARQAGILTIDAIYAALDESCQKLFNFSLNEIGCVPQDFFPHINYSKYQINEINHWLENNKATKILIENGDALSNQAINFPLVPIIEKLANENKDKIFILSKKENITLSNIFYTSDIIKKIETDLNEISYLSTFCSLIIGRASGVFTFSLVSPNLFERKVKFLCFSHLIAHQQKYWLGKIFSDKINYSATFEISNEFSSENVYNVIKRNINVI